MRRLLAKLALFCVLLVILAVAVQRVLYAGLHRNTEGELGVWNALVDGRINAEVLCAGSSRTLVHFDPEIIGEVTGMSCYNIGLDGSPLNLQLPMLETYFRHNVSPKVLVQGLGLESVQCRRNLYHAYQYIPYLAEDDLYRGLVTVDPDLTYCRYVPLYGFARYGEVLRELVWFGLSGRSTGSKRRDGFLPVDRAWSTAFADFRREHSEGRTVQIELEAVGDLRTIIELAQSHGTRVVLVYSPEYRGNQELTLNRADVIDTFRRVAQEYGVPYWDYSDLTISGDTTFFYNSQHLNRKGAELFSGVFATDLEKYLADPPP